MSGPSKEEDPLTTWLRERLAREQELLIKRHDLLVQEFQKHQSQTGQVDLSITEGLVQSGSPKRLSELEGARACDINKVAREVGAKDANDFVDVSMPALGVGMDNGKGNVASAPSTGDVDPSGEDSKQSATPKAKAKLTTGSFVGPSHQLQDSGNFIARLVVSHRFETFFAAVIGLNMVAMAAEMQYSGIEIGHQIGYPTYTKGKKETWPGGEIVFALLNWTFGIIYTIESGLKLVGLGRAWCEKWNLFDSFVVIFFYFEKVSVGITFPIDTMILRLVRLAKVLRLLRLVHEIAGLEQLLLMVTALKGSLHMLSWATMLLVGCLSTFAFVFNQILNGYVVENTGYPPGVRDECFKYFGTFSRAIFSMFELTLGNWIPISRFLIEEVNGFFVVFAILYKLTLGFAVVGVVNACFIKETFKIVSTDRHMMVIDKNNEKRGFIKEMLRFMAHADESNDGTLTQEEFMGVCQDEGIKAWWGAQGLDVSDAPQLFKLMDDGSGELSPEELVRGVARLKGPSRALDTATNRLELIGLEIKILEHLKHLEQRLATAFEDGELLSPGLSHLDLSDGIDNKVELERKLAEHSPPEKRSSANLHAHKDLPTSLIAHVENACGKFADGEQIAKGSTDMKVHEQRFSDAAGDDVPVAHQTKPTALLTHKENRSIAELSPSSTLSRRSRDLIEQL